MTEAAAAYVQAEAGSIAEQLDAICEELTAGIYGMDINGKSIAIPGAPANDTLQATQVDANLFKSLEEDVVTISVTKSDGTVAMKNVKLGDSMQELEEVNGEIDATLEGYNKATKSVEEAFQKRIVQYQSDVRAFHQWTIDEVMKARKEDKAYAVEANRKLQEFAASLIA